MCRHLLWQARKLLGLFPFVQRISESNIISRSHHCGVSALINNQGLYDFNNMSLLKLLLQAGGDFFDVGANIGSYTLIAAESAKARVFAFEPGPATYEELRSNLKLNGCENVRTFNRWDRRRSNSFSRNTHRIQSTKSESSQPKILSRCRCVEVLM